MSENTGPGEGQKTGMDPQGQKDIKELKTQGGMNGRTEPPAGTEQSGGQDPQKPFITQKITGRREGFRRSVSFFLKAAAGGVVFALAAAGTLYLAGPALRSRLGVPAETVRETVHVGRDSQESAASGEYGGAGQQGASGGAGAETQGAESASSNAGAAANEGGAGSGAGPGAQGAEEGREAGGNAGSGDQGSGNGTGSGAGGSGDSAPSLSEKDVRKLVREELESHHQEPESGDLKKLYGLLKTAADQADQAVARVTQVKEGVDWFDNALQTAGIYSGIAVARTGSELLVLTTEEAVQGADALTVSFGHSPAMEAQIRRLDPPSGLAVLSVAITEENEDDVEQVTPVELGNSYQIHRGDLVIALGAPLGLVHSADYGSVNMINSGTSVTDGTATVFYTDACGNASRGTWILNQEGQLVGWVTDALHDASVSQTAAVGISEYKAVLERMMNGQASPLFGIHAVAVLPELVKEGVPAGIYVTDETRNSPAYEAGIQPGDIITEVGNVKVSSMREFVNELEKLHAQDLVQVTVARNGRDEYTTIEFQLTVGAR